MEAYKYLGNFCYSTEFIVAGTSTRKEDFQKLILGILDKEETHGYEINEQLTSRGVKPHLSYLYRVLADMEKNGYIESSKVKSNFGPDKKIYRIGKKGAEELDQELKKAVLIIHSRYVEYLQKLPPQESVLQKLQLLLDANCGRGKEILVIAPKVFYDWMVSKPCEKFKEGNIYLVKPSSAKLNVECSNLRLLDTPAEKLFLRDNFIDTLRVHGEPENLREALKEFHRVLKTDGTLILIVPYFQIYKEQSPLTMGEFVEKVEHEQLEERKPRLDHTNIVPMLLHYFRKVNTHRLAHLEIFIAKDKI